MYTSPTIVYQYIIINDPVDRLGENDAILGKKKAQKIVCHRIMALARQSVKRLGGRNPFWISFTSEPTV